MTARALASFSEDELAAELQRRRFVAKKVRHVWTCHCGAKFVGGGAGNAYAERGQLWCRPCYPGWLNSDSERGPVSVPMTHTTEEI